MRERIAEFIREKAYKPMTFSELAQGLGIAERQQPVLRKTLELMEAVGEVVRTRTERYGAPERMNLAVGRLQGHPKGFGFLVQDEPGTEDIFIGRESLNGAWHNDRVIARLNPATRPGGRIEGEVIRILQRAHNRVVGTFETAKHTGYVTPDEKRLPEDIFIPKGMTNGAKTGEKVVVQIVQWPDARRNAEGRVVERLGMKGQPGVDIVSVIRKFGLPEEFPPSVIRASEKVADVVTDEAIQEEGRRDLRSWTIVTIDGEDAKDLDDAISIERIRPDRWRLGVHIADVAYYVPEASPLDREAYKRGTSVYLADRVVPMLPPRLSNGICSLNPGVDRLTLSCVMEIDDQGKVVAYELFPSVIKTAARMTYTRVNQILGGEPGAEQGYERLAPLFREMLSLMEVLRIRRGRRGALDFDLPEAKVKLDAQGWPVDVLRVDRGVAERLIEEFMLIANETVAEHCNSRGVPFMYRIHESPAMDRLVGLREFLGLFGYNLKLPREGEISPKELQAVIDWSRGRPEENLISSVLLRTMRQAVYSEENLGHFGLASEYYCHFTSPIRRYPDLMVHRVLRILFAHNNSMPNKLRARLERTMSEIARHSSDRERVAVEAERETLEIKKAEYMSDKVGESFAGMISGVTQWGFYVQLPNTVEGLVHVSTLVDDYYHFHEEHYALIGERGRRRFRLGDAVVVRVNKVDVESRQIDFQLDQESEVLTVVSVPGESRSRAAKKAALSAQPQKRGRRQGRPRQEEGRPVTAAEPIQPRPVREVEAEGPKPPEVARSRRGAAVESRTIEVPRPRVAEAPVTPAPTRVVEVTERLAEADRPVTAERPVETERPRRRRKPTREAVAPEVVAAQPLTVTAVRQRVEPEAAEEPKVVRLHAQPAARRRLDMWGVPLPAGRSRVREISDPSVINPFSVNPPPRRERNGDRSVERNGERNGDRNRDRNGERGAERSAQRVADRVPARRAAVESAVTNSPEVTEERSTRSSRPRRRRTGARRKPQAEE